MCSSLFYFTCFTSLSKFYFLVLLLPWSWSNILLLEIHFTFVTLAAKSITTRAGSSAATTTNSAAPVATTITIQDEPTTTTMKPPAKKKCTAKCIAADANLDEVINAGDPKDCTTLASWRAYNAKTGGRFINEVEQALHRNLIMTNNIAFLAPPDPRLVTIVHIIEAEYKCWYPGMPTPHRKSPYLISVKYI